MTESGWVLVFGAVVIGLEILVMLKRERGWGTYSTRLVGITLVIVSVMFLIISKVNDTRLASAFGLLGTIAGYLIGKSDKKDD